MTFRSVTRSHFVSEHYMTVTLIFDHLT